MISDVKTNRLSLGYCPRAKRRLQIWYRGRPDRDGTGRFWPARQVPTRVRSKGYGAAKKGSGYQQRGHGDHGSRGARGYPTRGPRDPGDTGGPHTEVPQRISAPRETPGSIRGGKTRAQRNYKPTSEIASKTSGYKGVCTPILDRGLEI